MRKIENTPWAKGFKRDCPTSYKTALRIVKDPSLLVRIEKSNELWKNKPQWAIVIVEPQIVGCERLDDFWLDSFDTKKEAVALCTKMRWRIEK